MSEDRTVIVFAKKWLDAIELAGWKLVVNGDEIDICSIEAKQIGEGA